MHHLNRYYFQVLTTVSARCCLIGSRTSGLRGFHLSQRSGSEVTLQFHSEARASESSSHHTNCSSSAGWEGKGNRQSAVSRLEFRATLNPVFQSTPERSVLVKRFRAAVWCCGTALTRSLVSRNHSGCSWLRFMGVDCRQNLRCRDSSWRRPSSTSGSLGTEVARHTTCYRRHTTSLRGTDIRGYCEHI